MSNRISNLFQIKYPIIQGGMIWCSGWELASAVSNAGGLGLIGAGSMYPDVLKEHIQKTKKVTNKPFGVNIPLIYPAVEELIKIIVEEKVPIVFSSAGNPKTWTKILQNEGIKVAHVVSNAKFATKSEEAGVDAIVAEGFEAGGHNGREETTTLTLIPLVRSKTTAPLIAAGGIATGKAMLAAMVLGADGVQMGSRFVASTESSAHQNFKNEVIKSGEGATRLALKKLIPVRLLHNNFAQQVEKAELEGKSVDFLKDLLGKARSKQGMFDGDIVEGELEIGQVAAIINKEQSVQNIINDIILEYKVAKNQMGHVKFAL
ncbi:MAG: nitronate monooxygenase [Bacteroidetes bacterium 4572_117]|nr:MAG: nitronate monooxygenase [Bacteroidetes bacterium 4572_117]